MNTKLLLMSGLVTALGGCGELVIVERPAPPPPPPPVVVIRPAPVVVAPAPPPPVVVAQPAVVVAQPAPVVVVAQPAPVFVEEGVVVQGVAVVAPPALAEYVFINGGWYYWHPGCRCWVHAHRAAGWHPPVGAHIYHSWGEHPMYHH